MELATFGAGCFWCVEACFKDIKGVLSVQSGFSGGELKNPTYKEVYTGETGHAEVAQIEFDPSVISYQELLKMFWFVHDPTQVNRQGNDIGSHYRSILFYHTEEQKKLAESFKQKLSDERVWEQEIVTEIVPFLEFFPAEDYHTNYYALHPEEAYCSQVVRPKIEKFKKVFGDNLKE